MRVGPAPTSAILLGVRIDVVESPFSVVEELVFQTRSSPAVVFTPNAEMLLLASRDAAFRETLNASTFNVADSIGVTLAVRLRGEKRLARIPGISLGEAMILNAWKRHARIALVGGRAGVAEAAAENFRQRYPELEIIGCGGLLDVRSDGRVADEVAECALLDRLNAFAPFAMITGFGVPKDEYWIVRIAMQFPATTVFLGAGGAIDVWAGRVRRAPAFVQRAGFEWLWRFLREPYRLPRLFTAIVLFPLALLSDRKNPFIEGSPAARK